MLVCSILLSIGLRINNYLELIHSIVMVKKYHLLILENELSGNAKYQERAMLCKKNTRSLPSSFWSKILLAISCSVLFHSWFIPSRSALAVGGIELLTGFRTRSLKQDVKDMQHSRPFPVTVCISLGIISIP